MTTEGAVVSERGLLVSESLLDEEHLRRSFSPPPRVRRPRNLEGEWAALLSPWSGNYFHWLIDCLPRVAVLQAFGLDRLPLVVRGPLEPFQRTCLRAISAEFTCMADDDHVQVDSLVWASPAANVNFPTQFLVDWLRRTLNPAGPPAAPDRASAPRHLYVSRRGARRILNEDDLISALRPFGFEVMQPEALELEQQVQMFSRANVVVGPHGAGLTNMVFAQPGGVVELFPPERVAWHYYMLAQAAGHDYWYVIGHGGDEGVHTQARDFEVDVPLVIRTVEAMLERLDRGPCRASGQG